MISKGKKDTKAKVLIFDPKLDEEIEKKEKSKNTEAESQRRALLKKAFSASEFESGQSDKKRKTLFSIQSMNISSAFKSHFEKIAKFFEKLCLFFHSKIKLSFVYVVVTGD